MKDSVTFVMTSCNRFDLLKLTLESFIKYNTYPVSEYIFIEDTKKIDILWKTIQQFPEVYKKALLLHNNPRLGQIKSIDKAYSYVKTDYIFHCEEDWKFYRSRFIENSLELLKDNASIINVWLREPDDTNGHPVDDKVFITGNGIKYQFLAANYLNKFHGFTFNPTLKRVADYKKIAPFENIGHEGEISDAYFKSGYRAAIFLKGSVKHEGWHRRVLGVYKKRPKLILETDACIKKKKAAFYKAVGLFGKKYKS